MAIIHNSKNDKILFKPELIMKIVHLYTYIIIKCLGNFKKVISTLNERILKVYKTSPVTRNSRSTTYIQRLNVFF